MKEHPALHIRVTRPDASLLFALPDPQPDLFVFSSSISFDQADFLTQDNDDSPIITLSLPDGEALLCGVSCDTLYPAHAFGLLSHLAAFSALDKADDSAI